VLDRRSDRGRPVRHPAELLEQDARRLVHEADEGVAVALVGEDHRARTAIDEPEPEPWRHLVAADAPRRDAGVDLSRRGADAVAHLNPSAATWGDVRSVAT
jgi:hypothetical protein